MQEMFDNELEKFFAAKVATAKLMDERYARLWEEMRRLVQKGGKRLRPRLVLMTYEAFGGKATTDVMPVAIAQELLHIALLIHDDIIDRDYTRYGVPNIAGAYQEHYRKSLNSDEALIHYAHASAMLAGDLLFSQAYQLIAESILADAQKIAVQDQLSQSIFEVIGGELLDTEASFSKPIDPLVVARYKTASYSFVGPILTGAILSGAAAAQRTALVTFAENIGIAYQLVDDLLGTFGDSTKTGKSIQSDICEGKKTFMVEVFLNVASPMEKARFQRAFGNTQASKTLLDDARQALEQSGAKKIVLDTIKEHRQQALDSLVLLDMESEYKDNFANLVTGITERDS